MLTDQERRAIMETANWWTSNAEWGKIGIGLSVTPPFRAG